MTDIIQEPTFIPLNGRLGWRTGSGSAISEAGDALRLAADPAGPLGLGWRDGSLGGLILPRGFALDSSGRLYLLVPGRSPSISRFDPETDAFVPLPGIGGRGRDARRLLGPGNIAIAGRNLYVADTRNRRVQVFDLATLALRYVWAAPPVRRPSDAPWRPLDVAAHGEIAYVLDSRNRRIYRHRVGYDGLRLFADGRDAGGCWRRVAVDRAGRVYVLDTQGPAPRLLPYDAQGRRERELTAADTLRERVFADAGDVRDRFDPPAIRLLFDHYRSQQSYFCLPAGLRSRCDRQLPEQSPTPEVPLALCPPWSGQADATTGGTIFDRTGKPTRLDPAELVEYPLYQTRGEWISTAIDSTIFRCQWHRIELELDRLPPGTSIQIHTYSADDSSCPVPPSTSPLWEPGYGAAGQLQPPPTGPLALPALAPQPPDPAPGDFLIQSRQGQYLWLKITLKSDGFGAPTLRGLRLHFPRESYLGYLPAVYAADDNTRWFLERYLSLFQTDWDILERKITESIALFDPDAVPPGAALDALSRRFGLPLEGDWSDEQRRNLLRSMRDFYTKRGTAEGLRAYLQVYLQNISGLDPAGQRDFPMLVEGWRERRRLELATPDEQPSGAQLRLWGPSEVGRLQLGTYARVGEARLVDIGDPAHDLFQEFAHRFRVYVPAAWLRSADDERMLRRALDAEKPAHAAYELSLVDSRFRIGVQSTVGIDMILGDIPRARLTCPDDEAELPPSCGPRHRLGYDTVLSCSTSAGAALPADLAHTQM